MRDRAEDVLAGGEREQHAFGSEPRDRLVAGEPQARRVQEDEVRLDLVEIDRQAGLGKPLSQPSRVRVILGEPVDVVVERVEPGSRDDPCLAHRSSEEVLETPSLRHALVRARDDSA